jgi:hypothetical protein
MAGGSVARTRAANVGSLLMTSSTAACAAARRSASASSVYGTTRRPAACARETDAASTGHPGETHS